MWLYLNALWLYKQALDSRFDAYACVCATGWVNGGHLGLAGASVNGTGERHSAPRTALRCCGALRGADCSVLWPSVFTAAARSSGPDRRSPRVSRTPITTTLSHLRL